MPMCGSYYSKLNRSGLATAPVQYTSYIKFLVNGRTEMNASLFGEANTLRIEAGDLLPGTIQQVLSRQLFFHSEHIEI